MLWWTLRCTCFFQIWFPWCVCPGVGLLDHMAVLFPDKAFLKVFIELVTILLLFYDFIFWPQSKACGILACWPGIKPAPPQWKVCVCVCVKVTQSFPTLCDSINCSPPASFVHGILQARILEWVAMPSSRGSSQPRDQTWVSCIVGRFFTDWSTREAVEGEDLQIIFFDIQINLLLKVCKFFYFLNLN